MIEHLENLKYILPIAWSKDTAKGRWTPECPPLNQCAVTSMLVQDMFGGELLRCECDDGDSHYWNRLPNGKQIDLTFEQFKYSGVVPDKDNFVVRDREYVDSFNDTVERYNLLKFRIVMAVFNELLSSRTID